MILAVLFFITALLYACVGFGGGSTYSALLILSEVDYKILPLISLICNLIVVSGGVVRFSCSGHIKIRKILPWIIFSVPAAWLGGNILISEAIFTAILGAALFLSGIKMLLPEKNRRPFAPFGCSVQSSLFFSPVIGGGLGFLAGITGIGGGIFLAPVLHFLHWDNSKNIAGTCSLFILVNSVSGLLGQVMKYDGGDYILDVIYPYWFLFFAVLLGGQLGSWIGADYINKEWIKRLTALLILYVAGRILFRFVGMVIPL